MIESWKGHDYRDEPESESPSPSFEYRNIHEVIISRREIRDLKRPY
jgi:hypothetical protein